MIYGYPHRIDMDYTLSNDIVRITGLTSNPVILFIVTRLIINLSMRKTKKIKFFSLFFHFGHFWKINWLYHTQKKAANFWAELDLNQRRHIVNEFTVRPH